MKKTLVILGIFFFLSLGLLVKFLLSTELKTNKIDLTQEKTALPEAVFFNETKEEEKSINLMFLGDVMLDRYVRTAVQKKGIDFLTEKIKNIFSNTDEVIFNLEGPVTKNASLSQNTIPGEKNHMHFTFNPETTGAFLKNINSQIVFIGNNHILNFGQTGLAETEEFLTENKVGYFGDPKGKNESLSKEIAGKKVAFVAFNQFSGEGAEMATNQIQLLKKTNDYVVLYAHWGTEYARQENSRQKEWAHSFIDAGADLVIGSHPHVIQPVEEYHGKIIFYSLGNFVFDQYFSADTLSGLAVKITMENETLDFYLLPLTINLDTSVSLSEGESMEEILSWLAENSQVPEELKAGLKSGHFKIKNN